MALSSLSDAELWNLILTDDYRAFTALYERYWLKMYNTALKYLHDEQASEEVVHDLFLNIWNRKRHLEIKEFDKYFKAATRYQVFAYLKKHKHTPVVYMETVTESYDAYDYNTADKSIAYKELELRLNSHLQLLPLRCKEIFLLSRMHHYTNFEIAQKLGINKRTVENQLTHALQSIRGNMKDILFSICVLFTFLLK
ncbi:sigma-70 family RNA polymerase sigma factor [Mucilaginibacter galii]|uniref:DNA-directed RNA polymerase sigma-70 factor n=1 Tax=Mucilaginibacter galii TaxID=2005073 RepID=A0A917J7K2_9SPHI|nr:sigma-70 family RNA polymerase sigma factor [Mucilaginibacter galii]GGI49365.1 DNA-directed RNA polymerase sigma-70 factor [Mucilaginibacter galii]